MYWFKKTWSDSQPSYSNKIWGRIRIRTIRITNYRKFHIWILKFKRKICSSMCISKRPIRLKEKSIKWRNTNNSLREWKNPILMNSRSSQISFPGINSWSRKTKSCRRSKRSIPRAMNWCLRSWLNSKMKKRWSRPWFKTKCQTNKQLWKKLRRRSHSC